MKIGINYGTDVTVVPGSVREKLADASAEGLRVLLSVCADPSATDKARAKELGISVSAVTEAIAYWRGAGVIFTEEDGVGARAEKKAAKKRVPRDESLPRYTTGELTEALGKNGRKKLIEYCQQSIGRMFNAAEAEKVVGICDYLNVEPEFVALLCDSLVEEKKGRMSLHVLEKTAMDVYDRGITTTDELIVYFEVRKRAKSIGSVVRKLYGLGARSFTPAEERMLEKWADARLEDGMIEYAYELTVNATGEAPVKYTDAIIDKWIADGVKTLDAAKAREEEYQKTKAPKTRKAAKQTEPAVSSFSTDDFFEAALMRSYNSDTEDAK